MQSRMPPVPPILPARQRGAVLFVALIMLVIFTLLAVSGVSGTLSSLRVAGNAQSQAEAASAAQLAIERVVDNVANFQYQTKDKLPSQVINVNVGAIAYPVTVTLQCLGAAPVAGYSASFAASAPSDSYWELAATAVDAVTGATVVVHQGLKVTLSPGQMCPG